MCKYIFIIAIIGGSIQGYSGNYIHVYTVEVRDTSGVPVSLYVVAEGKSDTVTLGGICYTPHSYHGLGGKGILYLINSSESDVTGAQWMRADVGIGLKIGVGGTKYSLHFGGSNVGFGWKVGLETWFFKQIGLEINYGDWRIKEEEKYWIDKVIGLIIKSYIFDFKKYPLICSPGIGIGIHVGRIGEGEIFSLSLEIRYLVNPWVELVGGGEIKPFIFPLSDPWFNSKAGYLYIGVNVIYPPNKKVKKKEAK